jgi:uncharacterized protein DUF1360
MTSTLQQVDGAKLPDPTAGYSREHRPLAGYSVLTATFALGVGAALVTAIRKDRLPRQISSKDLVLAGVATHKVSRLISKDRVTGFLRAPFTRYQESAGHGEVEEEPRGTGLQRAIGELVLCPYCLGNWVAAGFVGGFLFAPRTTRVVAGMYTALTISDFLQMAHKAVEQESGAG